MRPQSIHSNAFSKVQVGFITHGWEVVKRGLARKNALYWRCRHGCGQEAMVSNRDIRHGKFPSHDCQSPTADPIRPAILEGEAPSAMAAWKRFRTHGGSKSREFRIWKLMKSRCSNPNVPHYHRYGGRGITVCERWSSSFENFLTDMGPPPTSRHTVERIDGDRGYELGNCRWATRKEQSRNTSTNHRLTHGGRSLCLIEWAEVTGIPAATIRKRLQKGWTVDEALTITTEGHQRKRGVKHESPQEIPALPCQEASDRAGEDSACRT